MSVVDKYLTYRGDVRAVAAAGGTLLLVTAHPEGRPTALYRIDAEKLALAEDALPAGGADVVTDGQTVWIAGTDRRTYRCPAAGGKVAAIGEELPAPPAALALLADGRLGVLAGAQVVILSATDGKVVQVVGLPEAGTCLAADPTGRWVAVGTNKGTVCVLDCEDKPEFLFGESAKLHEGPVTALLFEQDDLRFLSAGADGKLLSTHARGKLEPEDKGKGNNHADRLTAMLWAPAGDRLVSGGRDATLKSWPRTGGAKPATLKDGVAKVVDLAVVQVHGRASLAAACEDNTVRLFPLDAAGKPGDRSRRVHGAAAWAANELGQSEHGRREAALRTLAGWGDASSVEPIAQHAGQDADHALRLLAGQLVAESTHPRAVKLLEKLLGHGDEPVRLAALAGLRKHQGEANLTPLSLALAAEKADLGKAAIAALEKLAPKDDQALALLTRSLGSKTAETRLAALAGLENVLDPQSPDANLSALGSVHADVRRAALLRLYQRGMLDRAAAQTALRRAAEDPDGDVRALAFRLSLYTRPRLVETLRARDPELNRQLTELEGGPGETAATTKKATKAAKPKAADALEATDYDPLLQATAGRALDTCLRGARGLAVLGDERALGLLLQLSREQDASARVEVARALGALADPRGAGRLRSFLFDPDAAVRDAAFTALERLGESDPLAAADAALGAPHEDVRRRGLQAVIAACRRKLPQDAREPAWPLLVRALNDPSAAVRGEAFKAALNLQICGGGVNTLRFALQSVHPEVRREVLTEAMASVAEPWAWELLLEFLADPDPKLRQEAFDFATKRNKELEPLEAALKSPHADVRRRAVEALVKRHTKAAQALLATALADDDKEVRRAALAALVGDDVRDALRAALNSPHDDVRARAANALARHGDAGVLQPLVRLATVPEPPAGPAHADWLALVESALDGMADLGDPAALPHVQPLLDSPHAALRRAAARALAWVALDEHPAALGKAMRHDDPQVRHHAALGLALGGDASAAPLVFSAEAAKVLASKDRLTAALALGPAGEDQLVTMLDHADVRARTHAFLLLMLLELKAPPGVPARCLSCLSCVDARTRLRAARGLDSYREAGLFLQFVKSLFDDRGDEKPWDIPAQVVDTVAGLIAHGSHRTKARTSGLLGRLFKEEQGAWDRAWAVHEARFADQIAALQKGNAKRPPPAAAERYSAARLEELAFGAYVGLVREQGGSYGAKQLAGQGPEIARVRQTALKWVAELARRNPANAQPARAVFVQAMGDPNQAVRLQAFDHLREMGTDPTTLADEALGTGHTELGVRGLELLSGAESGATSAGGGQAVLEQAMLTRTDDLATEAAKLLMTRRPATDVAAAALAAVHEPLRLQAVEWLAAEYERSPAAARQLRAALTSRYAAVREAAALELARKRDVAAFEPLVALLRESRTAAAQNRAISAVVALGDAQIVDALLDRLEDDPSGTAQAPSLLEAVASFRNPKAVDRLLALAARDAKLRKSVLPTVWRISGHDQPIEDPDDARPDDRAWLAKQQPRHDAVLARLLDRMLELSPPGQTLGYVPAARWSLGKDVDPVLARMAAHPDDNLRRAAVEALGFRARKRGGSPDALLAALAHRDPTTQFLAAEGLARIGRGEGLSILLAAVDSLPTLPLRQRAVNALGELADPRALDTLLRLATEDDHVLQRDAAEALGHLGRSPEGAEIFKLLERLATNGSNPLSGNALRGLRWLGTPDAWRVIRGVLGDESHSWREVAAEMLGFDEDDPATRELLLKVVATDSESEVASAALAAARRLFGPDSLEPHYAWVQNPDAEYSDDGQSVEALAKAGDARRLFEILPKCPRTVQEALADVLLNRAEPPVTEAAAAVASPDATTARVAARVLGRAGESAPPKARAALQAGLDKWLRAWDERRGKVRSDDYDDDDADDLTPTVRAFVWAAGRTGAAEASVIAAATAHADDPLYRPIRREAIAALDRPKPSEPAQAALEAAATGDDPDTRALAADVLARRAPARAARLAKPALADRPSFDRIARDLPTDAAVTGAVRAAAGNLHEQGVAVPHLVARGDADALGAVAVDRAAPEVTRLGAVEALGALASETGEQKLVALGKADAEPAELRKAAWRALRRSKRARVRRETHATGTEAKA